MNARPWLIRLFSIMMVLVVGILISIASGSRSLAQDKEKAQTRWEYKTLLNPGDAELNRLGAQGWELLQVTGGEPYVQSTSAPNAAGTRNTISYARLRYHLRRSK